MIILYGHATIETMSSKNVLDDSIRQQSIRTIGKLSQIMPNKLLYIVSSVLRDSGSHASGRSADISGVIKNSECIKFSTHPDDTDLMKISSHLMSLQTKWKIFSQILAPDGLFDIRLGQNWCSWTNAGELASLMLSHQDHIHITFERGKV